MRQHLDALTNYRRYGKADHEAPTCWYLLILATSGICNEMSTISIDSNKGDDYW